MNAYGKVNATSFDKLKHRIVKLLRFGSRDVQTADEVSPFGIDSNPTKNMVAIYATTVEKGEQIVIGYLLPDKLAEVGETRIYSTDANGGLKFHVWLKNDGTLELGGNAKHLARYEELKAGFDQLKEDLNNIIVAFNSHMHATAASGLPSPPTPGAGIPASASTASIDSSKIDEIKTL